MANVEMSAESIDIADIQNMKVADLRKKLKSFGLPTTGNKTELMDRLQDACLAEKDESSSSQFVGRESSQSTHISYNENESLTADLSESSQLMEDPSLIDQEPFSYVNSSLGSDTSKPLGDTTGNSNVNLSSTVPKPLKKRVIVKSPIPAPTASKKLILNRTQISYADLYPSTESPVKTIEKTPITVESTPAKVSTVKTMSESEKLALRAKRFNISKDTVTSTKLSKVNHAKPLTLSNASSAPDIEVLQKRAKRFGQNVSTVLKQIEDKEKLLKRKYKFGASVAISASSNLDEEAKKVKRAERFGRS